MISHFPVSRFGIPSPIAGVRLEERIFCIKWIWHFLTIYKNQALQQATTRITIKTKLKPSFWNIMDSSGVYY